MDTLEVGIVLSPFLFFGGVEADHLLLGFIELGESKDHLITSLILKLCADFVHLLICCLKGTSLRQPHLFQVLLAFLLS